MLPSSYFFSQLLGRFFFFYVKLLVVDFTSYNRDKHYYIILKSKQQVTTGPTKGQCYFLKRSKIQFFYDDIEIVEMMKDEKVILLASV